MTIEEKISQTVNSSAAIDRLGIETYNWWSEALHGVARSGRATVFPQAIGMAATFDPSLLERVGEAVSDEARAINNHLLESGKDQLLYQGLTFWSPNVNIFRDPRWGRGQETYGEDPYLSGTLGASFIRGMQGCDPTYLKVGACAKHFAVHSGPEALRHEFNALASPRDLRETYLPAFKMCVDGNVAFRIPRDKFSYYNKEGQQVLHKGQATITIANASPGQRSGMLGAESYEIEVDVR